MNRNNLQLVLQVLQKHQLCRIIMTNVTLQNNLELFMLISTLLKIFEVELQPIMDEVCSTGGFFFTNTQEISKLLWNEHANRYIDEQETSFTFSYVPHDAWTSNNECILSLLSSACLKQIFWQRFCVVYDFPRSMMIEYCFFVQWNEFFFFKARVC
jgi:hypothetical protein